MSPTPIRSTQSTTTKNRLEASTIRITRPLVIVVSRRDGHTTFFASDQIIRLVVTFLLGIH